MGKRSPTHPIDESLNMIGSGDGARVGSIVVGVDVVGL
jgi:hypothetical protein